MTKEHLYEPLDVFLTQNGAVVAVLDVDLAQSRTTFLFVSGRDVSLWNGFSIAVAHDDVFLGNFKELKPW